MPILRCAILFLPGLLLAACGTTPNSSPTPETMKTTQKPAMVGGLSKTTATDPDVIKAAEFAATQLGGKLDKVLAASMQVVAGRNFHLKLLLADASVRDVVVYQDLKGQMHLSKK